METESTEHLLKEATDDIKKIDERRASIRRESLHRGITSAGSVRKPPDEENDNKNISVTTDRIDTPEITKDERPEWENKEETLSADDGAFIGDADDSKIEMPEEMPDIDDAGTGRFVTDALDNQRQSERMVFQKLIDESTELQNELTKTRDQLAEAQSQRDMFYKEREGERTRNQELDSKVAELHVELKKRMDIEDALARRGNETSDQFLERDQLETKLRDAQLKLKRLVKDMEEKDSTLDELTAEKHSLDDTIDKLEPHVDKTVFEEIMAAQAASRDQTGIDDYVSPGNVVRGDANPKSAVCVIQ